MSRRAAATTDLVALVGGPADGRDGRWLTAQEWEQTRATAEWHAAGAIHQAEHGPDCPATAALRYADAREWTANPKPVQWPQGGAVWRWQRRPVDE